MSHIPNPFADFKPALDRQVDAHRSVFDRLFQYRFWLLVMILATLFVPVLLNRNTANLSHGDGPELSGYDVAVPSIKFVRGGVVTANSWALNPIALAIYGLAAFHAFRIFKGSPPQNESLFGMIYLVATVLLPVTYIPVADSILPRFNSQWHCQSTAWGFYLLLLSSLSLWLGAYAQKGEPVTISNLDETSPAVEPIGLHPAVSKSGKTGIRRVPSWIWVLMAIFAAIYMFSCAAKARQERKEQNAVKAKIMNDLFKNSDKEIEQLFK